MRVKKKWKHEGWGDCQWGGQQLPPWPSPSHYFSVKAAGGGSQEAELARGVNFLNSLPWVLLSPPTNRVVTSSMKPAPEQALGEGWASMCHQLDEQVQLVVPEALGSDCLYASP